MIKHRTKVAISKNIIELFVGKKYEEYVLEILNMSKTVFPGSYDKVEETGHGEPDYICLQDNSIYDVKLPFETRQVKMLTSGKKHAPMITKWINELREEASHMDVEALRNDTYSVKDNKLYRIMFEEIKGEIENNEHIIFFMPFLIGHCYEGFFLENSSDCLDVIFNELKQEKELNFLANRELYVICPDGIGDQRFVLRNLSERIREKVNYSGMSKYFTYSYSI